MAFRIGCKFEPALKVLIRIIITIKVHADSAPLLVLREVSRELKFIRIQQTLYLAERVFTL